MKLQTFLPYHKRHKILLENINFRYNQLIIWINQIVFKLIADDDRKNEMGEASTFPRIEPSYLRLFEGEKGGWLKSHTPGSSESKLPEASR